MIAIASPHHTEAERALLGAVLLANGVVMGELGWVTPEHFYRDAHRLIWRAMGDLHREGAGVDELVLIDRMTREGTLPLVGEAQIHMLAGVVPMVGNYVQYAEIVYAAGEDRRRVRALRGMYEALRDGDRDAYQRAWEAAR